MPRVLVLNWRDIRNPKAGGAEIHLWEVFTRMRGKGWDVAALCAGHSDAAAEEEVRGIRVHRCGNESTYPFVLPFAYARITKESKPDIVVDCLNKLPLFSPLYARRPLVCFAHHLFGTAAGREVPPPLSWTLRMAERLVPQVYRHVPFLTGSESTRRELIELGVPEDRISLAPYGADTSVFQPGKKSGNPSLLYVGRLKKYKGIDHVLRLMPQLLLLYPDLTFHIVGRGEAERWLRAMADTLGVADSTVFHGHVAEDEKLRLYQEAWALCFPSFKEGFGLTIPEAALCGTPTVGYDVPGIRDAVDDGQTGMLVKYGDENQLAHALAEILEDGALRERLSQNAYERYREFSWDNAAEETMKAIEATLGGEIEF